MDKLFLDTENNLKKITYISDSDYLSVMNMLCTWKHSQNEYIRRFCCFTPRVFLITFQPPDHFPRGVIFAGFRARSSRKRHRRRRFKKSSDFLGILFHKNAIKREN